jgi:protein involved in polysaccharide export with SLBB domain
LFFLDLVAGPALSQSFSPGTIGAGIAGTAGSSSMPAGAYGPSAVEVAAEQVSSSATTTESLAPSNGSVPEVASETGSSEIQIEGTPSSAESFFNADSTSASGDEGGVVERRKASAVSLNLKQFGYDFFRKGFTADQQGMVGPDYVVGPGDSMRIDIWGNIEGNYQVTIDRNGEITLPKIGVINLWGQTFTQAQQTIDRQISKYFTNYELNVTMGSLRSIQIFLVGEVRAPGTYQVSSLSTIVTALSSTGGPAKSGSLRKIQLLRNGHLVGTVDLYDFFLRGDKSRDIRLQSGDTLFVPVVGPLVGVAGNVRRPAIYELQGGESLQQVIALAGGLIPTAYLQKVQVSRVHAHQSKTVLDLDLAPEAGDSALNLKMQDRDMVKVSPIAMTGGYVKLDGYVVRPGEYQLTPGMRLSDLIVPYDNLLPEFFPGMAQVIRLNPPEFRPEALTVNLQQALNGDPEHNLLLQEYDTVKLFSRQDMEELPQIVVSGAVLRPGSYRLYENMSVRDLVLASGNVKRSAYLAEAEITRFVPAGRETKTERMLIDLEKALAGDPAHNLTLSPDDHLFVRSIPDYAEKLTVQVGGEVLFPGTYAIHKGETLSSVLERAGGFTADAYLRGAMFSRESLKEMQRQRLNQLITEQEQEIMRISSDMAQGAISKEEMASAQEIVANRSAMLEKLKNTPVLGRMVVHLDDLAEFRGGKGDIELVGGDVLTVPKSSQSVSVFGQVYNPITLAHQPGKTVGYYLKQVGGAKKDANTDEMFVVRADGTVVSAAQSGWGLRWDGDSKRWLAGGFNATILHPGDSILVPQQVEKSAWLREFRDISTIIYQIALGAAAVASF